MIIMRLRINILFLFIALAFTVPAWADGPEGYLNFACFQTPKGQAYFETYLIVVGNSMKFVKNSDNKYVATAHVTLSFKRNDSTVASANFNLLSPEVTDTSKKPDFIDVHRFWLPKGTYTMNYTIDDPNNVSHKTNGGKQVVRAGYPADTVRVSDAEFMSSYTPSNSNVSSPFNKCGYTMVPYVFANYPASVTRLSFYCEIYNTHKVIPREKFTVKYAIENDGDFSLSTQNYSASTQLNADTVVPFMAKVPIDNLATGSYFLSVSVVDANNHVLAKRRYSFTKYNPGIKSTNIPVGFEPYMATRDTLEECIRCLAPISGSEERQYVIADSLNWVSMPELKRFFYYFWVSRDSLHPLNAWHKYLADVLKVDHSFNTRDVKGYRTDRGRVYLQYGPPNVRVVEKMNPATYPHEIWQYYKLPDGQINVKFVFYTKTVETNDYQLLHSTASGEIQNPQWQSVLYSTIGSGLPSNLDNETVQDQMGEDVNDEFNNPH